MNQKKIVGVWSFTEGQITLFYKFNLDLTGSVFVPNVFDCPFTYLIDESNLTITIKDDEPVCAPYRIDGNKLIVCENLANQRIYIKND